MPPWPVFFPFHCQLHPIVFFSETLLSISLSGLSVDASVVAEWEVKLLGLLGALMFVSVVMKAICSDFYLIEMISEKSGGDCKTRGLGIWMVNWFMSRSRSCGF